MGHIQPAIVGLEFSIVKRDPCGTSNLVTKEYASPSKELGKKKEATRAHNGNL
jgi:hypothetical protein